MKCCDITAGQMRTPVTFQRKALVSDGAGGFDETWTAIAGAPSRARVEGVSGAERLAAARIDATTTDRLVCRYFAGLTAADRVVIDGVPHRITWVDNIERRNRFLDMRLSSGVAT